MKKGGLTGPTKGMPERKAKKKGMSWPRDESKGKR